ncbi:hypothetical protein CEN46_22155 [Fischerella thermalis CCMEE 5318]|uniref:Uncharacterized protein n=1 Tax=Fischerella thermalis CCMEE 5318 TaxID=2019666 RepID=A0A2N6L7I2_9CYAN|nr:hypothetical protein CEN46_22155 [Fischerella thermalis CCMEE 5318]
MNQCGGCYYPSYSTLREALRVREFAIVTGTAKTATPSPLARLHTPHTPHLPITPPPHHPNPQSHHFTLNFSTVASNSREIPTVSCND